ncbi:extracellular solute-binding protein [Neosynechococcus sphagnicola]|uniref:extracellular solute-binding protein n=1 Tax=Neosynechococcus sphagnicola TaxID=1501145 RepID=UPI001EF9D0C6|nr:extracellular solute-binding protein [Neosynechococcus sphagnicola]
MQLIFERLQHWQQLSEPSAAQGASSPLNHRRSSGAIADLVTLGDYWLATAIRQGLLQPLEVNSLQHWVSLPSRWQALGRRDRQTGQPDSQGAVFAAPYRWGTTVIAYRRDKFQSLGWTPSDWSDLWRPELQGKISLLDQAREVIGFTLKQLGQSYNTLDLSAVPGLKSRLQSLNRQVKFYRSTDYLQPLLLGDTWLAVGWSADVLAALPLNPQIAGVIPLSGTALWADLWVRPHGASPSDLVNPWIDFCWQPAIATQLSLLSKATSPIVNGLNPEVLPTALRTNPLLYPAAAILERSEFLEPLPASALAQYQSFWQQMRTVT